MATATGPITIQRINYSYTAGEGSLTTIQKAVTYAISATGYGDVIIPQGYLGTDDPTAVTNGSVYVYIIDTRNGQRKTYAWSGTAYVLQPLKANSAVFSNLQAGAADFDSCIVSDSPVRTFANTPGGGDIAMVWPDIGVPISEGDHWRAPSIDPNTLARTDNSNVFVGNQFIEGIAEITPNNTINPITSGTYGLRIGWNSATRNETDFINGDNYGTGNQGGGFYWYNENPNVPINPSTTPSMSLDGNNNLTTQGMITSFSNQTTTIPANGFRLNWNATQALAETDFINSAAGGPAGGFRWYNGAPGAVIDSSTTPLMVLDQTAALYVGQVHLGGQYSNSAATLSVGDGQYGISSYGGTLYLWNPPYGEVLVPLGNLKTNGNLEAAANLNIAQDAVIYGDTHVGGSITASANISAPNNGVISGTNIISANIMQAGTLNESVPDSDTRRWRFSLPTAQQTGYTYPGQFLFATQTSGPDPHNDVLSLWHTSDYPGFGEVLIGSFTSSSVRFNSPSLFAVNIYNSNFIQTDTFTANTHIWTTNLDVSGTKNFRIPHPLKEDKDLVHSCIEGPEAAIFYRGEGETSDYKAVIELPDYFEALARKENRTVQLTALVDDGDDAVFGFLAAGRIVDGKFKVQSSEEIQKFYWEVKAVRADIAPVEVEPDKAAKS